MVRCLSARCGLAGTESLCKHLLKGPPDASVRRAGLSLKESVGVPSLWGVGSQHCCALCCKLCSKRMEPLH